MQEVILLSKEEYNALLEKANAVVDENHELVSKDELISLRACEQTLYSYCNPTRLCPKCKKAMLVTGLVCPCCGFDGSDYYMENHSNHQNRFKYQFEKV